MAVDLLKPVLSNRTRSINFFNGRLLAGEDLTTEQKANRAAHSLLGQAVGDGIIYGLEVKANTQASTLASPVLAVSQGLAVNKNGATLFLETDTQVALSRPPDVTNGIDPSSIFQDCKPTETGTYIAGAGVYLLTIGPATGSQGLAEVSGISTSQAPCNTKYNLQGVQFRLLKLDFTTPELNDTNHLRNLVAYRCFGVTEQSAFVADPFNTTLASYGLLDQLRSQNVLTNCEVPLAVLYWTATSGIVFVDMWAARRPVFPQATTEMWMPLASRRRISEGLAMFLQFQEQVEDLAQSGSIVNFLPSLTATDYFRYLPAAGLILLGNINPTAGFDYLQFFKNRTYRNPVFMEGAKLEPLFRLSLLYPPIDLSNQEMLWLYQVRENQETIDNTGINPPRLFMVFTNGQIPFQGDAKFDLNYWNYANFV
jgi:hypothetical protein